MGVLRIETPCKINLHLGVHFGTDDRGYHRVDSLMVPVALFDTLEVREAPTLEVIHEPALEVEPCRTTVWRAATLLAEGLGVEPKVSIRVVARIPEKAGLGGSSADAGAALRALASLWGVPTGDERVVQVARKVGADVPFFLEPACGLYLGGGDVLERSLPGLDAAVVLVMPAGEGVSTKEAYDEFDRTGVEPVGYEGMCAALEAHDLGLVARRLFNNLDPVARRLSSSVDEVSRWLADQAGVMGSMVTGSGACSFALCADDSAAALIAAAAEARGWRAWATRTLP